MSHREEKTCNATWSTFNTSFTIKLIIQNKDIQNRCSCSI